MSTAAFPGLSGTADLLAAPTTSLALALAPHPCACDPLCPLAGRGRGTGPLAGLRSCLACSNAARRCGDGLLAAAGRGPKQPLGAVGCQPGDLIVEGVGVAGVVAGPGDGGDDDAMDGALDAWGVGLDEGLHGAQVETAPTAATMTVIVQRAAAATDAATAGRAPVGAEMDDDGSRGAIDADMLDEGAIDAEQLAPHGSSTHEPVIPFGPKAPSNAPGRRANGMTKWAAVQG